MWSQAHMRQVVAMTIFEQAASVASLRGNLRAQARPGRIAMLRAEEAHALLDYIEALERDRDGWRAVAGERAQGIAERERDGIMDNNKG